jgi:hypothetical protein
MNRAFERLRLSKNVQTTTSFIYEMIMVFSQPAYV